MYLWRFILTGIYVMCVAQAQSLVQEQVQLYTDRTTYMSGEDIWFEIEVEDAAFGLLSPISQVVYAELWSQDGELMAYNPFYLKEGYAQGRIRIPESYPTSFAALRVYTRWMLNQETETLPQKTLSIFQQKDPLPILNQNVDQEPVFFVRAFPEGGQFVAAVPNRVGIEVVDLAGRGIAIEGEIINEKEDILATVQTGLDGLAMASWVPSLDHTYSFRLPGLSKKYRIQFPEVQSQGVALQVNKSPTGIITVQLYSREIQEEEFSLRLSKGGLEWVRIPVRLYQGQGQQSFQLGEELKGLLLLEVINAEEKVWASAIMKGFPEEAPKQAFQQTQELVGSTLYLDPFLKGIDSIAYLSYSLSSYIPPAFPGQTDTTNILHSLRIPIPQPAPEVDIAPEYNGFTLRGKVTSSDPTNISHQEVGFAITGSRPWIQYATTDQQGRFQFVFPEIKGTQRIACWLMAEDSESVDIQLEAFPPLGPPVFPKHILVASEDQLPYLKMMHVRYLLKQEIMETSVNSSMVESHPASFGEPDRSFNLDEYTRFVMAETFSEIVYFVSVKNKNGVYSLSVEEKHTQVSMPGPPLLLIDGIPYKNVNDVMDLSTSWIASIEVYRSVFHLQGNSYYGIIQLNSKPEFRHKIPLPTGFIQQSMVFPGVEEHFDMKRKKSVEEHQFTPFLSGNLIYWKTHLSNRSTWETIRLPDVEGFYLLHLRGRKISGKNFEKSVQIELIH